MSGNKNMDGCVPQIKTLHSPEVDNLDSWIPEGDGFYVLLQLGIGPRDEAGSDNFEIVLANPEGLRSRCTEGSIVVGDRGLLVLRSFEWREIQSHLRRIVSSCGGRDWVEVSTKLQRYFFWEYEDYAQEEDH